MSSPKDLRTATYVVAAGRPERLADAPLNTPIIPASSFHAGGSIEYAREDSPTAAALEDVLGGLELGTAIAFASGMGAANAVMDLVPMGGVVVAPSAAYTGVAARLRELAAIARIELRIVDVDATDAVLNACEGAHLLWLESPTNPLLQVADLEACIAGGHRRGAMVLVDNTFATPIIQRPIEMGADLVMHSVTKSLAGHSDLLLGAIIAADPELAHRIRERRVLLGAAPNPFDAYLALRGIRTLAIRVERAQENARDLARRLTGHPAVQRVRYPGFGSIISIEVAGSVDQADAVCQATEVWTYATSLGGVESLLERRRRWPLESSTVPETLLRLSVGIEDVEDLWTDLDAALRSATGR